MKHLVLESLNVSLFLDAVRGAKRVNTIDYVNPDMKSPLALSRIQIEQLRKVDSVLFCSFTARE